MTQIMRQKSGKYYLINDAEVYRQTFNGKFDQDLNGEPPIIKRMECYVSFEKSGSVLVGNEYSAEMFASPIDYFRDSFFITLGDDYRAVFDLQVGHAKQFLPELQKLKFDIEYEGCLNYCKLTADASLVNTEVMIENEGDREKKALAALKEFETMFNNKYMPNIKNFIQSIQTVYKINDLCAKVVKMIKFAEFRNGQFTNLAVQGVLGDLYIGNDLNVNEMGIFHGYKSELLFSILTFDRQCMINKMFGRAMYE